MENTDRYITIWFIISFVLILVAIISINYCTITQCSPEYYQHILEKEKLQFQIEKERAEIRYKELEADHRRRLEYLNSTPVEVQVEQAKASEVSLWEGLQNAAVAWAVWYWAVKFFQVLWDL